MGDAVKKGKQTPLKKDGKSKGKQHRTLVSRFLVQTYEMVQNPNMDQYVSWDAEGKTIMMNDIYGIAKHCLPVYFKHENYASFVRQLNMYGFRRKKENQMAFANPLFQRGRTDLLAQIKRNTKPSKAVQNVAESKKLLASHEVEVKELMNQVKTMKQRQSQVDAELFQLKARNEHLDQENFHLWEAMSESKRRHEVLLKKTKQMIKMLQMVYANKGDSVPELEGVLGLISNDREDLDSPSSPLESSREISPPVQALADNDLTRQQSIKMLPSLQLSYGDAFPKPESAASGAAISLAPPERSSTSKPILPDDINDSPRGDAKPMDNSAMAMVPFQGASSGPADALARNNSLQSFMAATSNVAPDSPVNGRAPLPFGKYNDLARGVSELITDQDNTFKRLHSLESTISFDPEAHAFEEEDHAPIEIESSQPLGKEGVGGVETLPDSLKRQSPGTLPPSSESPKRRKSAKT